jgi:Xaa-Pro aminopeptidase
MSAIDSLAHEYPERVGRARALMAQAGHDALLLFTGPNLSYFSGMPTGRSGSRPFIYLLPRAGDPVLIVHDGRQFEARALTGIADIRTYSRLSRLPLETLLGALGDRGLLRGRIGAELGGEMVLDLPFGDLLLLRDALPAAELVDASPLLWSMRMQKSPAEIARVARACAITSQAYARTFAAIRPGMHEAEAEAMLHREMLALGGQTPWVLITSGAGKYDLVSKGGSDRLLEPGDMVWFDGGCAVDGYWSDFSRAGVIGGPTTEQTAAQEALHAITRMGVAMVQPGMPVAEIAARCNRAVEALDLPLTSNISALAGRVGHGLGRLITELPSLSEADETSLAPGMIVTIEPGVATHFGTFHVEENVLVTAEGPRLLSSPHWELWTI